MKNITRIIKKAGIGFAVFLVTASTSLSDDIDLYVDPPDAATPGDAFVIFTLDLRPNVLASEVCTGTECDALFTEVGMQDALVGQTTFLELLTAALKKVLGDLDSDKIHVGLMVTHDDTTDTNTACVGYNTSDPPLEQRCSNGAYVMSGFKTTSDQTQMDEFFAKLESLPLKGEDEIDGNWGHSYQLRELFFEMYRYVTNGNVFNGENGWHDFKTDATLNIDDNDDTLFGASEPEAELMWDADETATDPSGKRYVSGLDDTKHCSSLFSVNLVDGTANQDDNSDSAIQAPPPGGMGITLEGSNFRNRVQVLEYLSHTDLNPGAVGSQHLTSFFVARTSGASGDTGGRANDWAQAGGTDTAWLATNDPDELVENLGGLFNEILGVSTTFVAASVPANVFNRAQTLNEVFLAIFEPHDPPAGETPEPFWVGNVKKLTTATIEETIECVDTDNDGVEECTTEERRILVDVLRAQQDPPTSAIAGDGRIRPDALTYWTRTGFDNEYLPAPPDGSDDELEYNEGTDGRKVDRGGAGQVKPGYLGSSNVPGAINGVSTTTLSGPRKILSEADDPTDSDGMVNLDADAGFNTAVDLLTDSRSYPGSNLSYGEYLYQTVMSDCTDCASSYSAETSSQNQSTAEERVNNLILFARGYEFSDVDTATGSKRSWWQADPLHSRPLALNYGARTSDFTEDRPDIRVLVSGNDGMFQMIRDGRNPDGSEDGVEAWAFLPREFIPLQKRLLEGDTGIYDPGTPYASPHKPLHPYALDGAPTALVIDNNLDGTIDADGADDVAGTSDDDQVYAYIGQRRGGKRYYALNLSDPDNPKLQWSIGKGDAGGDFAEMGQSWSLMRAGVMRVKEGTEEFNLPVLAFTGGYNGDDGGDGDGDMGKDKRYAPGVDGLYGTEDDVAVVGTDDDEGNALFIVHALTGELIWKVTGPPATGVDGVYDATSQHLLESDLVDSVASSPTTVDSNGDGLIDRIYFPDTGGNVWRMDAGSTDRANWTVTKLFAGGRHDPDSSGIADDRRFFHAPDVVFADDQHGDFDAVIITSGDRAQPLNTGVENWIYMIKDRATTSGNPASTPLTPADLADLTDNCLQSGDETDCTETQQDNLVNGWMVRLNNCEAGGTSANCGEKGLASPLTIEGTIFLTTYLPLIESAGSDTEPPETCGPKEGRGLFYALNLQTAGGVLDFDPTNNGGSTEAPDRFDPLRSEGVPPEPVAVSPDEVLRPDLSIQKTEGRKGAKTFWYDRRFN